MSKLLKEYYSKHHKLGKRIGQAFAEQLRGSLFARHVAFLCVNK
jgi:hypothetical protein